MPVGIQCEGIIAGAEIGEVLVSQPGKEGAGFVDLGEGTTAGDFDAGQRLGDGFHLGAHGREVGVDDLYICKCRLQALLQIHSQRIVQQRQVDLDGGALAGRSRHDRVKHGANLDLGVLADIDRAIDQKGDVSADDLGDIQLQRPAVGATGAAHTNGVGRLLFVVAVEGPKADGEGGGVLRRQGQKILDKGVRAVLSKEARQRLVDFRLWSDRLHGGEKLGPGKCEFVGQGMSPD